MKVGIDLGTTNSVIARIDDSEEPEVISNKEGEWKTKSIVLFREDEEYPLVGTTAERQKLGNEEQTVERVKRHMGNNDWTREILGEEHKPEGISARILRKLIDDAEVETGETIEKAVITVPADFGTREREATTHAALMAYENFTEDDIQLLTEPVAACLRYGVDTDEDETIFVYDLGGGTFDATIVEVEDDDFAVDGTKGGKRLGGEDFDDKLYDYVRGELLDKGADDPENSDSFKSSVMDQVTETKHALSNASDFDMGINVGGGEVKNINVTRSKFNELTENLVEDTITEIDKLFKSDNVDSTKDDIDRVLLVGGSTRIPRIQERVEEYFDIEPSQDLRQDFVVAEGAAIQTTRVDWSQPDGDKTPDEPSTQTVLPETIGIAVQDDDSDKMVFKEILEENTTISDGGESESKRGFKKYDKQTDEIEIEILEGGEPLAEQNDHLADFTLENLEPGSDPEFEVEFTVTDEARLTAEVTNLDTGQSEDHTIEMGLSEVEVDEEQTKITQESEERSTELMES